MTCRVSVVKKNRKEEIRVTLEPFNGHDLFQARVWFETEEGDKRPGKSGIAFRVDRLPEFAAAVNEALRVARQSGQCK